MQTARARIAASHRQDAVVPDGDALHVDIGGDGSGSGSAGAVAGKNPLLALDRLQSPASRAARYCGSPYSRRRMTAYSLSAALAILVLYAYTLSQVRWLRVAWVCVAGGGGGGWVVLFSLRSPQPPVAGAHWLVPVSR